MALPSAPEAALPHALVLSFPMQGHINPVLQVSSKLAFSYGFSITFVLSEFDYSRWKSKQKKHKDDSQQVENGVNGNKDGDDGYGNGGRVQMVGVPDKLPPSRARTAGSEFRDSYEASENMREGVEALLFNMQQPPSPAFCKNPVTFVLADTFVDWAHMLAQQFQLPLVSVFASNASSALVFLHAPSLVPKGILPFRDENDNFIANEPVSGIPGIPPLHPRDFPICFTFGASHYRYQFVLQHYKNFLHSSAMLINTLAEIEVEAIESLRQHVYVFPVGPMCPVKAEGTPTVKFDYWEEQVHCLEWLDMQKPSSVVYISFGSISTMPRSQMEQLALGLEAVQQPFLWVIRSDSIDGSLSSTLPEGYLERTKEQGLIVSWAPQLSVLSHPSVGAFMTHCGWNSAMENISLRGLPVICWPLVAEQRMNTRIFVDQWRIGIEVRKGEDGVVCKKEVERVVKAMMAEAVGVDMRARAAALQQVARAAISSQGSSLSNLEAFVGLCRSGSL